MNPRLIPTSRIEDSEDFLHALALREVTQAELVLHDIHRRHTPLTAVKTARPAISRLSRLSTSRRPLASSSDSHLSHGAIASLPVGQRPTILGSERLHKHTSQFISSLGRYSSTSNGPVKTEGPNAFSTGVTEHPDAVGFDKGKHRTNDDEVLQAEKEFEGQSHGKGSVH
jgi:hypothetical protein